MRVNDSIAWLLPDNETYRGADPEPDEEEAAPEAAPPPQEFVSRFGGLWIDRTDWRSTGWR